MSKLKVGSVIKILFPSHDPPGHEQEGSRPAIIVALPDKIATQRFGTVIVVPLTSNDGTWSDENPLYPTLPAGTGGVRVNSVVMLDQVCALDMARIVDPKTSAYLGEIDSLRLGLIRNNLKKIFGF